MKNCRIGRIYFNGKEANIGFLDKFLHLKLLNACRFDDKEKYILVNKIHICYTKSKII